tara:strand:+ start:1705 stop:1938 length:234 start_codon:yes stop_codon:yes gene_type:complete
MKNLRLVNVNTTAFSEEDFSLITDLTDDEIEKVIEPLVLAEREENGEYDNDELVSALELEYPKNYIQMVVDADYITI